MGDLYRLGIAFEDVFENRIYVYICMYVLYFQVIYMINPRLLYVIKNHANKLNILLIFLYYSLRIFYFCMFPNIE